MASLLSVLPYARLRCLCFEEVLGFQCDKGHELCTAGSLQLMWTYSTKFRTLVLSVLGSKMVIAMSLECS